MYMAVISLQGYISCGMAIHTARTHEYIVHFVKRCHGTSAIRSNRQSVIHRYLIASVITATDEYANTEQHNAYYRHPFPMREWIFYFAGFHFQILVVITF